jgi:hypothetical protein
VGLVHRVKTPTESNKYLTFKKIKSNKKLVSLSYQVPLFSLHPNNNPNKNEKKKKEKKRNNIYVG